MRATAMGVYAFELAAHLRPVVALVGAHGITDLDSWKFPPIYAVCFLVPMNSHTLTALFFASSLVHLAEDFGNGGSLVLHALMALAWRVLGTQRSLEIMLLYLAALHTPAHYLRCWHRQRRVSLALAGLSTLVAAVALRHARVVVLGHAVQRVVIAHVCTEYCLK